MTCRFQKLNILYDALVQQCFADIAAEERDAGDCECSGEKNCCEQRLSPAEAANIVQVKLVDIHVDCTRRHKEDQLDERVVEHVKLRAPYSKSIFLSQQALHTDADQNKTNLGDRRAGKRAFEVYGEEGYHGTGEHGEYTERKHGNAPVFVMQKDAAAENKHAEDTRFCEDAGEKGGGGRRSNRMRLRQPDVQGIHAGLGTKAKEHQGPGEIERGSLFCRQGGTGFRQSGNHQCAGERVEQEEPHQHHHSAEHGNCQISLPGAHGKWVFIMDNHHIRGEGHDFKEYKSSNEIGGEKHTDGRPAGQQSEEIIAISISVMAEVLF